MRGSRTRGLSIVLAAGIGLPVNGCLAALPMAPVPYNPNPHRHPLAHMLAEACAEPPVYGHSDGGGCAIVAAIFTGAVTILDARTRTVRHDVRRIRRYLENNGVTEPVLGVCLRPAAAAGATGGTELLPVTAPNLFLAEPWECY